MKFKRLLSSFLCAVMLVGTLTVPAFAAQTYEIEDTYSAAWGHTAIEDFVTITADSVKKGGQTSVGDFMTYHTYPDKVDTYFATGSTEMKIGSAMACDIIVCYANSWADLRANKTTYVKNESSDYRETVYSMANPGVYAVEIGFMDIPVKVLFAIDVSVSGTTQTPTTPTLKSFKDVDSTRWSHDAIMEMVDLGMFSGTTTPDANGVGTFNPTGTMTRAQYIVVVTRYLYGEELNNMVAGETWYSNNYDIAVENGIIKRSEFLITELNKNITRQEMAMVAVRVAKAQGQKLAEAVSPDKIADYSTIDNYYKDYVRVAFAMGLISGYDDKGTFGPNDTLTREQGAMVAYRLVTAEDKGSVDANTPESGLIVVLPDGSSTYLPGKEDENGVLTIYEGQPSSRLAKAGDIFVKDNGVKVVLEIGPNGILGEGQGVAPDKNLTMYQTSWMGSKFNFNFKVTGNLTDCLGNTLQNQRYGVNYTTGEGHWEKEWDVLVKKYPKPSTRGTYEGQVSTDPYHLYFWDPFGIWVYNF